MNLPIEIVTLITSHLDNESLERLSHSRAWQEVALAIKRHNYWFLRVENSVGKRLTYKQQADWKTTYYDLAKIHPWERDACFVDLLRLKCKTTLTLEVLLQAGYFPSQQMLWFVFTSTLIREQRDFAVVLLEHQSIKGNNELIYQLYMSCAGIADPREVQLIASYLSDEFVSYIQFCFS